MRLVMGCQQYSSACPEFLDGSQCCTGILAASGSQAPGCFVDQQQVDALALKPVVVIEALRVDDCDVGPTVLDDDFSSARFDIFSPLGKVGTGLGKRNYVTGRDGHKASN